MSLKKTKYLIIEFKREHLDLKEGCIRSFQELRYLNAICDKNPPCDRGIEYRVGQRKRSNSATKWNKMEQENTEHHQKNNNLAHHLRKKPFL